MLIKENLRYTKTHEWALVENGIATIGITDYAQGELGDIVFVELPAVGKKVAKGESILTVEAVKAVSDVYAPFAGEVVAANDMLKTTPDIVNKVPFDDGWMVKIKLADENGLSELLTAAEYKELLG